MPVSIEMLRRARERYNKLTPAERAIEDAYWARQNKIDKIIFRIIAAVIMFAGMILYLCSAI